MSAPLIQRLSALDRDSDTSITQQLVDVFANAIASGELAPGAKLPPTRTLALLAGVNQLTAGRCYRKLQELGLVVSGVGRGTFVRSAAGAATAEPDDFSWQTYALPSRRDEERGRFTARSAADAETPGLIPLSMGYPPSDLIPAAELQQAASTVLARAPARSFEYCPIEGVGELRAELAELGRAEGLHDDAESVVVTTGARQALTLVARAVLRRGDVVACESPTFIGIIQSLRATGATVMPIPIDDEGFNVDALEQLLRAHEVRMVALQPRAQNPTGGDLSPERRVRLLELAARHGFFVLEDAVYADLRFEGADPGPLRALDPAHVIYVDSLSKTVAPGLRTGWVSASGPVLDRIVAEKRDDDAHSATLTQQVSARFLADGHYASQLARAHELYATRRGALLAALEEQMGGLARVVAPRGGGHVWLTLEQARDDSQLYRAALEAGVSYVPGPAMLVERPRATHMRLSFCALPPEALREGVRRLAAAVRGQAPAQRQRHTLPVA